MKRIEFLRVWGYGTWTTEIVEVPDIKEDSDDGVRFDLGDLLTDELVDWANKILAPQEKYDGVALFTVYNTDPEEG